MTKTETVTRPDVCSLSASKYRPSHIYAVSARPECISREHSGMVLVFARKTDAQGQVLNRRQKNERKELSRTFCSDEALLFWPFMTQEGMVISLRRFTPVI